MIIDKGLMGIYKNNYRARASGTWNVEVEGCFVSPVKQVAN